MRAFVDQHFADWLDSEGGPVLIDATPHSNVIRRYAVPARNGMKP
jgi:hypothetical protein